MTTDDRRSRVAAALIAAKGAPVSGEVLAHELGVSRVAIGKHVTALRDAGFAIDAVPRAGYALREAPAAPLPEVVGALVRDPLWKHFAGGVATGSTNDDCKRLARGGAPEGTVVLAAEQTAGRGRFGRTWVSPEGGVYLSMLLRPTIPPGSVAPLTLAVGLGVARGLEAFGIVPTLKWPNDVLLADAAGASEGGGKLAGILLEMSAEADAVAWVVAGLGLNVWRPMTSGHDAPGAVYLAEATKATPAEAAAAVLDGVAAAYAHFLAEGFPGIRGEYSRRCGMLGKPVEVRDATGALQAAGVASDIDADGRLIVTAGSASFSIVAGEVTLRPAEGGGV